MDDFYNRGFGWICRHCENQFGKPPDVKHSRLMSEGEAESKQPILSNLALAKWADPARRTLVCPTCGVTELVDKY